MKTNPEVEVAFSVNGWLPQTIRSNRFGIARYDLDTTLLKPGSYTLHATPSGGEPLATSLTIGPAPVHNGIALIRWGHVGSTEGIDWLLDKGFSGGTLGAIADREQTSGPLRERTLRLLDHAAATGFEIGLYLHPLSSKTLMANPEARVLRPDGERIPATTPWPGDPLSEPALHHARELTHGALAAYGEHPALRYAMLCSEQRTYPGISEAVLSLAKKELGFDFAPYVKSLLFVEPAPELLDAGLVPDDHPLYRAMWWFHVRGHGTAVLNAEMNRIIKARRPDIRTSHEPWRLAPTPGTAKDLDLIGSWTYAQADLKRLFFATYLRTPGAKEKQKVQAILSIFVYGYTVMPLGNSTAKVSDDMPGEDPSFNAMPDYTREALWIYLSQRPDEICVYWGSRHAADNPKLDNHLTNPQTFDVIADFSERVLQPFGPALLATKPEKPKVAVHLSAVSTWFTRREVGWNKCEETLPYTSLLVSNHVPFEVILDDDFTPERLAGYEAVILPYPETLTPSIVDGLKTFAAKGGSVIANEPVSPALTPTKTTRFDFTPLTLQDGRVAGKGEPFTTAEASRSLMEGYSKELAPLVAAYAGEATASSPRVLTNTLHGGAVHYHFAINDDRAYGPEFGHHELFFELGVRQKAHLALRRPSGTLFYDILSQRRLEGEWKEGRFHCELFLSAGDGRIIASLPEAPAAPKIDGPTTLQRGQKADYTVSMHGASGQRLDGVIPLKIVVLDGSGMETSATHYGNTVGGEASFSVTAALNDAPGTWKIVVKELISGESTTLEIDGQ